MSAPEVSTKDSGGWKTFRVRDRYIKASKLMNYFTKEVKFLPEDYRISMQSDIYVIETREELNEKQKNDIKALSGRLSSSDATQSKPASDPFNATDPSNTT